MGILPAGYLIAPGLRMIWTSNGFWFFSVVDMSFASVWPDDELSGGEVDWLEIGGGEG